MGPGVGSPPSPVPEVPVRKSPRKGPSAERAAHEKAQKDLANKKYLAERDARIAGNEQKAQELGLKQAAQSMNRLTPEEKRQAKRDRKKAKKHRQKKSKAGPDQKKSKAASDRKLRPRLAPPAVVPSMVDPNPALENAPDPRLAGSSVAYTKSTVVQPAAIERARYLQLNAGVRARSGASQDLCEKRVAENKDEGFIVFFDESSGTHFVKCLVCSGVLLNPRKQTVDSHLGRGKHNVSSPKNCGSQHAKAKVVWLEEQKETHDLGTKIAEHKAQNQANPGMSLPVPVLQARCLLVECALRAGSCLSAVKYFKPVLRDMESASVDKGHLTQQTVGILLSREMDKLKSEVGENDISSGCDGTTRLVTFY